MKVLFVADTHGKLMQKDVNTYGFTPELIAFLGDHSIDDIEAICELFPDIRKIGVLGNHDQADGSLYRQTGIENIHLNVVTINGITFGGYGGSVKYKNDSFYTMHTQAEANEDLRNFPKVDVFLTHDKPKFDMNFREVERTIPVMKKFLFFNRIVNEKVIETERYYNDDISTNAHEGTIAVYDYLKEKQPSLHFYGHIHEPSQMMIGSVTSRCIYRTELVDVII